MKAADKPIIVEYSFNTTVKKAWNAISKLNEMKQWYFGNIEDFKAELGFTTQFIVQVEDRKYTHLWKIIEMGGETTK